MSFVLLEGIALLMPLRADAESESVGMNVTEHGEEAHVHGGGSQVALV